MRGRRIARTAGIARTAPLLLALAATGCFDDVDPPWQLDHDRIVAVRATPPGIASGERSVIDGLLSLAGEGTSERAPETAAVVSPAVLAGALAAEGGAWIVTAPDAGELAAARAELGLAAGAPVPLQIGVGYEGGRLLALKVVTLGVAADNPTLGAISVGGESPAEEIVVGADVDVPLAIEAGETGRVNWLTSCGEMRDFDLPQAILRVVPGSPAEGELAVVVRDDAGGVVWQVWPIRAE